jgi:hypothetical protein
LKAVYGDDYYIIRFQVCFIVILMMGSWFSESKLLSWLHTVFCDVKL